MKRIYVDFNTVMQDETQGNRVLLATDDEIAAGEAPGLCAGERVVAYDEEMEVEGIVERQDHFWLAALDWTTLKRLASAAS